MRTATVGILAVLATLVCSATSSAQAECKELLVGKWESSQKVGNATLKITCEFTKDSVKVVFDTFKVDFKYKWVDMDTIEVTLDPPDQEMPKKAKLRVTKNTLSLTDDTGQETKFTRVSR